MLPSSEEANNYRRQSFQNGLPESILRKISYYTAYLLFTEIAVDNR